MNLSLRLLTLTILLSGILACNNKTASNEADNTETPPPAPVVTTNNGSVDQSPMDIIYFPLDYPIRKMSGEVKESPLARVIYSRPQKKGRPIFGELQKFGEPWRLGANEASEIEFFSDVSIQNKLVKAGRYVIYCIPEPNEWEIILNNNLFSWGLHFDSTLDLHRFPIPVEKTPGVVEYFSMTFETRDKGANLLMAWDSTMARLPIDIR